MKLLFSPPSLDDLVRLLRAWRIWVAAAIAGALIAAAIYSVAPPPYRARATVAVDFNLEEAWPAETDRQQFYYLEREARKLEEIAWSDAVLAQVDDGNPAALRSETLELSQPAEGGWHFYAEAEDPARAQSLASAWARAFVEAAADTIAASEGLNSHIQIELTQTAGLPVMRSLALGAYLLAGTLMAWSVAAFVFLFFDFPQRPAAPRTRPKPRKSR